MRLRSPCTFRRFAAAVAAVPILASPFRLAHAQGEAQQLPSATTPAAPGARPAGGVPAVQTPVPLPMPNVSDPMLTPVLPASRQINTWQEALDLVRARSTDLRTSYDTILIAEAQERIALAQVLPQLGSAAAPFTGAGTHNFITNTTQQIVNFNGTTPVYGAPTTTPAANYATASFQLQQTLINLEQFYAIGTAHETTRMNTLAYDDMRRTIAQSVANDIIGVVTAERVAELNRNGLRQSLERLDLTVRKQRLGAATGLDVLRAQQDVESARTTLVTGDESLRKAREALGLAVGIPTEVGVPRDIQVGGLERDAVNTCRAANTIDERSDIRAARAKVNVQDRLVNDVWLQFLPTFYGQTTLSTISLPTGITPEPQWSIQGVLSWTLFDGGTRYGNLRSQRAQLDQANLALESQRRAALIQVEQAKRGVIVTEDQLRVADRARALAVQVDMLTQAAYREGQLTSLDLVTAAAARRQAEINYALDEFNLVSARVASVLALANCKW
jgi:multidrug efflux system outer membrane protein